MGELSVRIVVPMAMKKLYNVLAQVGQFAVSHAYPKVAADPIIYWPSVRSIPLGPGPKRTMLVNPSAVRVAARGVLAVRTEDEANDQADGCLMVRLYVRDPIAEITYIHPSCHPSSLHRVSRFFKHRRITEPYACRVLKGHATHGAWN
jgi:hypothetical protein